MTKVANDQATGSDMAPIVGDVLSGEVEIIGPDQMEIVEAAIRGVEGAALQVVDAKDAADAIVARILAAETAEAALAPQKTQGARELVGVPIRFVGVQWLNSKFEKGPGVYALAQGFDLRDGSQVLVTTSARNAMAQLFKCQTLGAFPQDGVFCEGSETTQGFVPMWIESVGGGIGPGESEAAA